MSTFYKKAFTLIELLVAIVAIGILSSLIIVSVSGMTSQANVAKSQFFSDSLKSQILVNLVSEWRFNGNANDTQGINNGSATGATIVNSGCVRDSCYSFDGAGDYLRMGSNASLNFTADYTIELFVYNGAGASTNPTLFNRSTQSTTVGYFWSYTGGTDEVNISYQYSKGTSPYQVITFSNAFPKNKWTYLVFTFTDSDKSLKFYRNGDLFSPAVTLTNPRTVNTGTLYFGTYNGSTSSSYTFKGRMDEIKWYSAAMPAHVIKEHYYSSLNSMLAKGTIKAEEYRSLIIEADSNYARH
ncbi:MAG: LamG-like jellyroll fold domain-containing protein [Candidatus Paceibacterota bacterium]|jgi:prepilin-type N-terminal cleavage/methylation domain-containing protein